MNFRLQIRRASYCRPNSSAGFTLVEMLVATGLVVLIMSLFAQIYATAIGSITEQRGMGNNDQKARVLTKILHDDLSRMSYKQSTMGTAGGIVPLTAGDEGGVYDSSTQLGYFYFSENDPWNSSDDVLQFTTSIAPATTEDQNIGKVTPIAPNLIAPTSPVPAGLDEPAADITTTLPLPGYGRSDLAEVSYFLRNGTLYRRVFLLRGTLGGSTDGQPTYQGSRLYGPTAPAPLGSDNYSNGTNSFWHDFDYAATRRFYDPDDSDGTPGQTSHIWFHGLNSLANGPAGPNHEPLGLPWNRFGHLNDQRPIATNHGQPREFLNQNGDLFLGRYTHQETSSPQMYFPGQENNPPSYRFFDRSNSGGQTYDYNSNALAGLTDGSRLGEDILLTNVESFDVEVWEPSTMQFVQLGHNNASPGEFTGGTSFQNANYGPRITGNNIFDTWHPEATFGNVGNPPQPPPFRPMAAGTPDANVASSEWQPNQAYTIGSMVRVPTLNSGGPTPVFSNSWVYEVVATTTGTTSGNSGAAAPSLPATLGNRVIDNELVWECVDKRIGLRAIRITIRYIDQQSRLPRQVTVVHSFAK